MNNPKRQHFIPQFYLRGFAQVAKKQHRLFAIDMRSEVPAPRLHRVEEVACQNHFYSLDDADDPQRFEFEEMLGRLDTASAEAVNKLVTKKALPQGDGFEDLIGFMGMLYARTPTTRDSIEKPLSQVSRQLLLMATENRFRWNATARDARRRGIDIGDVDFEQISEFVRSDRYEISMTQDSRLGIILHGAPIVMSFLARRNWSVVEAPQNSFFVTCDHPFSVRWNEPSLYPRSRPPGFGMGGTTAILPICASICLVGRFEPVRPYARATAECVASINTATAFRARRFVYSRESRVALILARPMGRNQRGG